MICIIETRTICGESYQDKMPIRVIQIRLKLSKISGMWLTGILVLPHVDGLYTLLS